MDNTDFILFTDGSYLWGPHGKYQAGYAVVSPVSVLENGPLPNVFSAQEAKLIALTRDCQLQKGNLLIFIPRAAYAFGVAPDFGMLWEQDF